MRTFLLIHGALYGAWSWYKMIPRLKAAGHGAIAIDLPGSGIDHTPVAAISLGLYVDCVCSAIDEIDGPIVLVGHSMGGLIISQVAEQRSERLDSLVYVAAHLLKSGQSSREIMTRDAHTASKSNAVPSEDGLSARLPFEAAREAFYQDCSEEDIALASMLLREQALRPVSEPLSLSEERYGSVPRFYIECLEDQSLSPELQKHCYTEAPCEQVLSLACGHSPFLSMPDELADYLVGIANRAQ